MTHYDIVEWQLFKEDLIHEKIREDMEDHLLECTDCMDIFLALVDKETSDEARVSEKFTDNVIKGIPSNTQIYRNNKSKKGFKINLYNELLVYYMAVASVAIFLMGSGFFSTIVSETPKLGEKLIASKREVRIDGAYRISKNITNITSNFVREFNLEIKERK